MPMLRFASSPWHQALHVWAMKIASSAGMPLFHVDLHGKVSETWTRSEAGKSPVKILSIITKTS